MRELLKATKALSDETRLRILNLLLERECCVCEVMQALGISETRASRNLRLLYDAGFLKLRRDGLWSLYSLNQDDSPEYFAELVQAVKRAPYWDRRSCPEDHLLPGSTLNRSSRRYQPTPMQASHAVIGWVKTEQDTL